MDKEMFEFYKNALRGVVTDPLCADFKNEWRGCGDDKEKLVRLAMRQQSLPYIITHCYQGKGVSKDYIQKNFANFINGNKVITNADGVEGYSYGLYVDYKGVIEANTDVLALMWVTNSHVTIEPHKCPTIYVGCGSNINLWMDGFNSIRVYLFDDSKVTVTDADDDCKVMVYKYSKNANVTKGKYCLADVKVFDKELRL